MPIPRRDEVAGSDTMSTDEHTLVDHTTDDEDEDYEGRPSSEVSEGDHDLLESEEERERLLTREGSLGRKDGGLGKREQDGPRGGNRRGGKKGYHGEASALMYEMEEGIGASRGSQSSERGSSESDERRLQKTRTQEKTRRQRSWKRIAMYLSIIGLFLVLLFVAYRVSITAHPRPAVTMVSNGTSLFAPTTILISLDGFRADFLYRDLTPMLNSFIEEGISPKYMLPSFPSVTFPNHYTMATGLYPEAHGVVGNTFWDPALRKEFYYTDSERSLQPYWWGGEPLWQTAERQNTRVAVHMWPGSEVHHPQYVPAYIDKYNGSEALPRKVNRIMDLLDILGPEDIGTKADQPRPQLIAAYVPNVDSDGHKYGPNSTEIRQTIKDADTMLGGVLKGLQERNLTDIVNVVVVSDHGMATTNTSRLIQLEDLIDPNELEHIDGWPHFGLRPKKAGELDRLHKQVLDRAQNMSNVEIYLKDKDMPERYHFSQNDRIAPLWIIPKTGWAIVTKADGDVEEMKQNGDVYHPKGIHGYDHEHPLMRAIFVARGPAFPHKPNSRVQPFQNIELYNIICDSIGISPAPNNGTLRLPLTPVGLHTDPDTPPDETPDDPVEHAASTPSPSPSPSQASFWGPELPVPSSVLADTKAPSSATSSAASAQMSQSDSWWEWLTHKADHVEEWIDEFLHDHDIPEEKGEGGKGDV